MNAGQVSELSLWSATLLEIECKPGVSQTTEVAAKTGAKRVRGSPGA